MSQLTCQQCFQGLITHYLFLTVMPHVVEPFTNLDFQGALKILNASHQFLVARAKAAFLAAYVDEIRWGTSVKRWPVTLDGADAPRLIGKTEEKFGEVINIAATLERLIDAIEWFAEQLQNKHHSILECHPSTSDETNGNDLVIIDQTGRIVIRCEVCDVASSRAGSNGKEKKDLKNLGCDEFVPQDGVARYICTASEFANALSSPKRPWKSKPFRYHTFQIGKSSGTCMLLINSAVMET